MEQDQHQQSEETGIDNIIGLRKYEYLRSLNQEDLTAKQKSQIDSFRKKQNLRTHEQIEATSAYFDRIMKTQENKKIVFNSKQLWIEFKNQFEITNGKPFVKNEFWLENISPLLYYFSQDERFLSCENLRKELSIPSFEKGLLIIGNFGNGKTASMKTFESIFKNFDGYRFKGFSANEAVTMFEKCNDEITRSDFEKLMWRGTRYFDDLKTERIASNFGKVNIFKEILEERYNSKSKTFITCNFCDGYPNDIDAALDEFETKYGGRVYDRIFEMFNIIEFKGNSFRR